MRSITTRTSGLLCICALLAGTSAMANAQSRIGTANSVQPEASGSVAGTLSVGSDVHANETVRTGNSGKAGLQFNDQSNLSVGPSSQIRLDKFVYDPNKGTGSTVIEATRGTFRFSTGAQNKGEVSRRPMAPLARAVERLGASRLIFEIDVREVLGRRGHYFNGRRRPLTM